MSDRIGIIGAGTWGMALANMLSSSGHSVQVWSPFSDEITRMSATHRQKNLPGVIISENITFTDSIEAVCFEKDIILFAVPSKYVRETVRLAAPFIINNQIVVDVAKGIESETLLTMTEVINDELAKHEKFVHCVALSGPTHAEEVARNLPTTIVAAYSDSEIAEKVQDIFMNTCMRVYTNNDVLGVELSGALKNIIALASGICEGLGYGDNTKAALITRGLFEIKRLGKKMGCTEETFDGLAGLGDLVVTSTSSHSRNNKAGFLIGKGYSPKEAIDKVGMVVEGINAIPAALQLAKKYDVELPIINAVSMVINENANPKKMVQNLMIRSKKSELSKELVDINFENTILKNTRSIDMRRVITYGTFDLLHYGHINLLRRAKALGDYLIVALSTDEFNWNDKHKKTYFSYEQRKQLLESIRYVDLVIPEENWNQKKTDMHEYHIDTFVMGDDWKNKFDFLSDEGVDVVYLPRTAEISSSKIKKDLYDANEVDGESKLNHDELDTNPQ